MTDKTPHSAKFEISGLHATLHIRRATRPLIIGDKVVLVRGSHVMLVTDTSRDLLTVEWRDDRNMHHELTLPRACFDIP